MSQPAPRKAAQAARIIEDPLTLKRKETNRDLVEQIVVALILAFLIRGFEAEAFVIPTGSMAPTLMGRHKEVYCQHCGYQFSLNASDEVEGYGPPSRVASGTCQNCRAAVPTLDQPSFKGDRILVMKFLYDLGFLPGGGQPNRWDVVVFKYPEQPEVNYIKRLVGLPGEDIRIFQGNVLTRKRGTQDEYHFARRPLIHQLAMQMMVWDDSYLPTVLADRPDWHRWRAAGAGAWDVEPSQKPGAARSYSAKSSDGDWTELRYEHRVPDPMQWAALDRGDAASSPRSTLVTDYYSYNTSVLANQDPDSYRWFEPHWVGDLTLSLRIQPKAARGRVRLELFEGGVSNRCEIDLATGKATLYHGDQPLGGSADTPVHDTYAHDIVLANVDDRLTLWVDGKTPFGEGRAYGEGMPRPVVPTEADLQPARVGLQGVEARVTDLVLKRDIYYTLDPGKSDWEYYDPDSNELRARPFDFGLGSGPQSIARTFDVLSDPTKFPELADLGHREFSVRPGYYLMMGDNSPRSKDSRGWTTDDQLATHPDSGWDPRPRESWEVPENLLIGKAFYIYWPHGKPVGPGFDLWRDFRVPFRPYIERMKWIR